MGRPHDRRCPHRTRPRFNRGPVTSRFTRNRRALPEPPPPPTYDFIVTGTLSPDVTGNYLAAGTYNGQPYYQREDAAYFIWYQDLFPIPFHCWWITDTVGVSTPPNWSKLTVPLTPPPGDYDPAAPATGTATVAAP